jgi:hypothetical protein
LSLIFPLAESLQSRKIEGFAVVASGVFSSQDD